MKPSKEEQIEALLERKACELVERYVPADRSDFEAYAEIFSVNRSEILAYLQAKYSLWDLVYTEPGISDGFYAIRQDSGGYLIYEQERSIRFAEAMVPNEDQVWKRFIDYIIVANGTGLRFE